MKNNKLAGILFGTSLKEHSLVEIVSNNLFLQYIVENVINLKPN